jgi:hypothetical protein
MIMVALTVGSVGQAFAASAPHVHNTAAEIGAQVAPEPFCSHWKACRGGSFPDQMRDQPLGHANQRAAGLLLTLEAIRYLREGQINKALLLASVRAHYIGDSSCIAHAAVWRPRRADDVMRPGKHGDGVWSFLPASVQDYWLPFSPERGKGGYFPLLIERPPLFGERWDSLPKLELPGSMHAYFDRVHPLKPYPDGLPATDVPDTGLWSAYDREIYGRWVAENIALTVLDRESVLSGRKPIRFVDAAALQKAIETDTRNMAASIAAYYRYLAVAGKSKIVGEVEELFPAVDRLALLARQNPRIYLSADAPWPLKRACYLLAMEIVRARYRNRGQLGGQYGQNIRSECEALLRTVAMPAAEDSRRVIISWKEKLAALAATAGRPLNDTTIVFERGQRGAGRIVIRGEDLQASIHLVDYLLDLTNAPLHGRAPIEVVLTVLRREWEGMNLLKQLQGLSDAQAATRPARLNDPHADDAKVWTEKVRWMIWPYTEGQSDISGPLQIFWNLLLIDIPLPDGKKLDLAGN